MHSLLEFERLSTADYLEESSRKDVLATVLGYRVYMTKTLRGLKNVSTLVIAKNSVVLSRSYFTSKEELEGLFAGKGVIDVTLYDTVPDLFRNHSEKEAYAKEMITWIENDLINLYYTLAKRIVPEKQLKKYTLLDLKNTNVRKGIVRDVLSLLYIFYKFIALAESDIVCSAIPLGVKVGELDRTPATDEELSDLIALYVIDNFALTNRLFKKASTRLSAYIAVTKKSSLGCAGDYDIGLNVDSSTTIEYVKDILNRDSSLEEGKTYTVLLVPVSDLKNTTATVAEKVLTITL